MDMIQINEELHNASQRLENGSKVLFSYARDFAIAEEKYRKALGKEIDRLKQEGQSVTLIPDIARGNLSELKKERDLAEYTYTSARDSLNAIKSQISALQTITKYQEDM